MPRDASATLGITQARCHQASSRATSLESLIRSDEQTLFEANIFNQKPTIASYYRLLPIIANMSSKMLILTNNKDRIWLYNGTIVFLFRNTPYCPQRSLEQTHPVSLMVFPYMPTEFVDLPVMSDDTLQGICVCPSVYVHQFMGLGHTVTYTKTIKYHVRWRTSKPSEFAGKSMTCFGNFFPTINPSLIGEILLRLIAGW